MFLSHGTEGEVIIEINRKTKHASMLEHMHGMTHECGANHFRFIVIQNERYSLFNGTVEHNLILVLFLLEKQILFILQMYLIR